MATEIQRERLRGDLDADEDRISFVAADFGSLFNFNHAAVKLRASWSRFNRQPPSCAANVQGVTAQPMERATSERD